MKSENIGKLASALCQFQGDVGKTIFDATNPFFKSKYATLAALVDTARKPLKDSGLSVSQLVETHDEGKIAVTTILMHNTGEWLETTLVMKPEKLTPQGQGSCITYARRYSYAAILGLVSDSDDDGNNATFDNNSKQKNNKTPTKTTQIKEKGNITQILNVIDVVQDDAALDKIKGQIHSRLWSEDEIVKINNAIAKRRKTIISDSEIPF